MIKKLLGLSSAAAFLAALAMPLSVSAAPTTVVVTPANTQGWYVAAQQAGGTVSYVSDPTSPMPTGALQLTTDANTASKLQYLHNTNTPLANVTTLSYATKQVSGPPEAAPSYQLPVCLNGIVNGACSGFTTLVYEPYYNGTVTPGAWQTWDVASGLLWSSKTVTCSNGVIAGTPGGPPTYTLATVKTACPGAVVVGYGVNVGTYNLNYVVRTDAFNFNGTVYNFELTNVPTKKNQCKDGGYKNYTNAKGEAFRNQGQCIHYVNEHGGDRDKGKDKESADNEQHDDQNERS